MTHLLADAVGTAAAVCSITSFLPQVLKIAREKDAASVSLWIGYGVLIGSWPVAVSNALALACAAAVLVMKLRYDAG